MTIDKCINFSHTGRVLLDSDAAWVVKYLAANREFSQSFQHYLKHVCFRI